MTDEPTEEQTAATAVVIGRGVAEAMRSENFPALRAWVEREVLDLPGSPAEADERGWRAGANAIATTIWNASPLPSNGYRARPLPPPGRNDPCPCGSGRKFKRCCGQVAPEFPAFPEEEAWSLLTPHLTDDELRRFTDDPELPPGPLARLALEMKDRGLAEAARAALVRRLEGGRSLDARDEPALEVFLDLEAEARDDEDFVAWASALAGRLPRPLEVVPCRHLLLWAVSSRQIDEAHALLGRMRASNPEDPTLAPLEVMTLLAAGDTARAAARARFWLPWLERRGLAEEMPEAVELLERAARDPAEAAREFRETEIPFLGELARLVGKAMERPVRPYLMGKGEPDAVFDHPPPGVSKAEDAWGRAWPGEKPELVALDADLPVEVQEEPEPWLAVLRKHPAAFDSLDVLDDLVLFTGPVTEDFDPSWGKTLLDPLLERAAAIVETSMAAAPSVEGAPWGYLDNRPPLRLLSRLAYRLAERGRAGEAAELLEQMLRWNPNDNHGHREWLVNHFLRIGDDEHALAVTDRYPDDMLVDTLFGRALALWRLGRKGEAEKAIAEAGADRPLVVQALLAEEPPEPDFDPAFISLGGEAEAWLYRERMRETWQATPGALEHLRGLPRPGRRKRRRRRPRRARS